MVHRQPLQRAHAPFERSPEEVLQVFLGTGETGNDDRRQHRPIGREIVKRLLVRLVQDLGHASVAQTYEQRGCLTPACRDLEGSLKGLGCAVELALHHLHVP